MSSLALAVAATVLIGSADFFGALASRHGRPIAVAGWSQMLGVPAVGVALLLVGGTLTGPDMAWGALSGIGIGLGLMALYIGFFAAPVGIVAPVAAVVTVVVPVVYGLAIGERPSAAALAGVALAVPGVALVGLAGGATDHRGTGVVYGIAAGVGFGVGLALLAGTSADSGLWPLLATRSAAGISVLSFGAIRRRPLRPFRPSWAPATAATLLGVAGMSFFTIGIQRGPVVLVATITAMFPAVTVALAAVALRERLRSVQLAGVLLALVAITLLSVG